MKDFSVVVVAAGNSSRMNGISKQLLLIDNIPIIIYSLMVFNNIDMVKDIVVVSRKQDINMIKYFVGKHNINKVSKYVLGGETRQKSVCNGLEFVDDYTRYVAIHDGARPLIKENDVINVFKNAIIYGASVLGVKVKDTIKIVKECFVYNTPDRDNLYSIQTPQVFKKEIYYPCLDYCIENDLEFTDDSQLLEIMGKKVYITIGDYSNIKITTQDDIILAKNFLCNDKG